MKRRLLTILSALSLLLCAAVCVLWLRSYFVGDRFFWSFFGEEGAYTLWTQDMVLIGEGGVGFKRSVQGGPLRSIMDNVGNGISAARRHPPR